MPARQRAKKGFTEFHRLQFDRYIVNCVPYLNVQVSGFGVIHSCSNSFPEPWSATQQVVYESEEGFTLDSVDSGFSRSQARRSNGLGALLLFTAVYMVLQRPLTCSGCRQISEFLAVLRDLWTSTGALPRDLALAVADDAPQEDASAFFTKAGIFIGAGRSSLSVPLRFSQPPHRDARPDSEMGSLRSAQRISGSQLYSRPPSLLPSCPPCASRLPVAQHAARAGPS